MGNPTQGNTNYLTRVKDQTNSDISSFELEWGESEKMDMSEKQKEWIKDWKVRNLDKESVFTDIFKAIKITKKGDKILKIIAKPNHIYLSEYQFDGKKTYVAVYGQGKTTSMINKFTKVQVSSLEDLNNSENKKHLYCDETFENYLIIALYEEEKIEPSLIIQVMGSDIFGVTKANWLKFLNIYREPLDEKSIDEIFEEYDVLTPSEISQVRDDIDELDDKDKKKEAYIKLQKKAPYYSQRNNETSPGVTCNVTSLAGALTVLGLDRPCNNCSEACNSEITTADYLYCVGESLLNPFERTHPDHWMKVAQQFDVTCNDPTEIWNSTNILKTTVKNQLENGCGVLLSTFHPKGGHVVRLLDVTDDGLIVDDPNGKLEDGAARETNGGNYNLNASNSYENKGSKNLWLWTDITGEHNTKSQSETFWIKYVVIFCK